MSFCRCHPPSRREAPEVHTDFSIQNEPACYQSPPPGWYIPCEIQTAVPFARWASTSLRMTQGWSGQGWWSLTAGGSTDRTADQRSLDACAAHLVQSATSLAKLSPAHMKKGAALFAVPLVGSNAPCGESFWGCRTLLSRRV